jgi:hypothetical protein
VNNPENSGASFSCCSNVFHRFGERWLEYWKILRDCANFIEKYVQYLLDIDYQISYNPIKHMSGSCGCGYVKRIIGRVYRKIAASQGRKS